MSDLILADLLNHIHALEAEILEEYLSFWKPVNFKSKEIITRQGQTENYLYSVTEGIQRSYHLKNGKEHILAFTYAPSFSGIPESFLRRKPSQYFLESITPSECSRIYHEDHFRMMEKYRSIETLFRKATEEVLAGFISRHAELLSFTIEERFLAFTERSPGLINKIPHKYIASYLRIDPTNFSKLLNNTKI